MKNIIIGILLGITLSTTTYAGIQLAQIPVTINGYNTIDLLVYVSQLKSKDDKVNQVSNLTKQYENTYSKPNCSSKGLSPDLGDCLQKLNKYNQDEKKFINDNSK